MGYDGLPTEHTDDTEESRSRLKSRLDANEHEFRQRRLGRKLTLLFCFSFSRRLEHGGEQTFIDVPAGGAQIFAQGTQCGDQAGFFCADEPTEGADKTKAIQLGQSASASIVHEETGVAITRGQRQRRSFTGIDLQTKRGFEFGVGGLGQTGEISCDQGRFGTACSVRYHFFPHCRRNPDFPCKRGQQIQSAHLGQQDQRAGVADDQQLTLG